MENRDDGRTCQIWQVFEKHRPDAGSFLRHHYSILFIFRQYGEMHIQPALTVLGRLLNYQL
jgi:hypothetical protein